MKQKIILDKKQVIRFTSISFFSFVIVISLFLSQYSYLPDYDRAEVSHYLDRTSESILLNSDNDTQTTQKIIFWEKNLLLKPFSFSISSLFRDILLRHTYRDPEWFVYIRRGNCGESALIFEDMANRTNLTYRKIVIDGFIDPINNRTENHRWSEVFLDDSWRIADSGFNLWYPKNNQSYFTVNRGYLIGHVTVLNNNGSFTDCTNLYMNETGKLLIKAVRNGNPIENASVSVKLNYGDMSCNVIGGNKIDLYTNQSGFCEINLGIYNDTYYTVKVNDFKIFYNYYGKDDVEITDTDNYLELNVDKIGLW